LPKAIGAQNLHKATLALKMDLEHFVTFSSLASAVGAPKLAGQAVADAMLDSLAIHRRQLGLRATSVQLGPLATPRANENYLSLRQLGFELMPLGVFFAALNIALHQDKPVISLARYAQNSRVNQKQAGLVGTLASWCVGDAEASEDVAASSEVEASAFEKAARRLATQCSKHFGIPPESIDVQTPMASYGLDSIGSMQLKVWIDSNLGPGLVSSSELIQVASIAFIVDRFLQKS